MVYLPLLIIGSIWLFATIVIIRSQLKKNKLTSVKVASIISIGFSLTVALIFIMTFLVAGKLEVQHIKLAVFLGVINLLVGYPTVYLSYEYIVKRLFKNTLH